MTINYYHVVEGSGMHGAGSRVRPSSTHRTLARALSAVRRRTAEYQDCMRPHGGTSGYYRVVTSQQSRPVWLGHEIDAIEGERQTS